MEKNKDLGADWLATNFNSNATYDLSAATISIEDRMFTEEGRSPFKMFGRQKLEEIEKQILKE